MRLGTDLVDDRLDAACCHDLLSLATPKLEMPMAFTRPSFTRPSMAALMQPIKHIHQSTKDDDRSSATANGASLPELLPSSRGIAWCSHHVSERVTVVSTSCVPGTQATGHSMTSRSRWLQPRSAMERLQDSLMMVQSNGFEVIRVGGADH